MDYTWWQNFCYFSNWKVESDSLLPFHNWMLKQLNAEMWHLGTLRLGHYKKSYSSHMPRSLRVFSLGALRYSVRSLITLRLPCWREGPHGKRAMPATAQLFQLFQRDMWVKTPTWRTLQPQQIQCVKNQETQPIIEPRSPLSYSRHFQLFKPPRPRPRLQALWGKKKKKKSIFAMPCQDSWPTKLWA